MDHEEDNTIRCVAYLTHEVTNTQIVQASPHPKSRKAQQKRLRKTYTTILEKKLPRGIEEWRLPSDFYLSEIWPDSSYVKYLDHLFGSFWANRDSVEKMYKIKSKLLKSPLGYAAIEFGSRNEYFVISLLLKPEIRIVEDKRIEKIRPLLTPTKKVNKQKTTLEDRWHLRHVGLHSLRKVGFKGKGKGVGIAVLDTGIEHEHHEFSKSHITLDPRSTRRSPTDPHGTHVAGLICGKTMGIAPESNVFEYTTLSDDRGKLTDLIQDLEHALNNPDISIINLSLGGEGFDEELTLLLRRLWAIGTIPIAAVGNNGENQTGYPGNSQEAVSVGATSKHRKITSFSSSNKHLNNNNIYSVPHLCAPGHQVYSAIFDPETQVNRPKLYGPMSGSSMSAPIVSGALALLLERYEDLYSWEIVDLLKRTCEDLGEPPGRQGKGLIRLDRAIMQREEEIADPDMA